MTVRAAAPALRFTIALSTVLLVASSANAASTSLASDDGGTVTFATSIDHDTVDAFIASVGERSMSRIAWTVSVATMTKCGILDVDAPAGYACTTT